MNEDNFLKVAKQAALEAGKIISSHVGEKHQKNIKHADPTDYATEADIAAEKAIIKIITDNFPDHNIVAEESGSKDKKSEYTWVIDPLDGSITFASGIPYFSVSIGLLQKGEPVLGVIYIVGFNQLYWAQKGKGAFLNGKPVKVSNKQTLSESIGVLDFGHNVKREFKLNLYVNKLLPKIGYIYSFGSAVACMAMVGEGILSLYVNYAFPWDFAAGVIIIREAGGKVTNFAGGELDWTKERMEVVASNGILHDEILEALKR